MSLLPSVHDLAGIACFLEDLVVGEGDRRSHGYVRRLIRCYSPRLGPLPGPGTADGTHDDADKQDDAHRDGNTHGSHAHLGHVLYAFEAIW